MTFADLWAAEVDRRFRAWQRGLCCLNPDHDRMDLATGMTPLVAWIGEHWECNPPAAQAELIRPYVPTPPASPPPAVGVAEAPDTITLTELAQNYAEHAADQAVAAAASELVMLQLGGFSEPELARIAQDAYERTYSAVMNGDMPA